ncbi:MAG: hypothetical protein ABMA01_07175 [Chthoniobacteraceae bacterium]
MTFLRPLFALFARSLREQSRTKFTSLSRAGIVLLILLFIGSTTRNLPLLSAPGLQVLQILAWVNFFTITVFGLSTFPSAITEEKEEDTLGLLQMTKLNPLAILLGKSTARLFEGFLLLAVQLPFTMLCITLGGVAQPQILRTYGILAAYLFLLCNVGLLWSVICRRTKRASSMTLLTGLLLYVLPLFFMGLAFAGRIRSTVGGQVPVRPWYQAAMEWILSINPAFDLMKSIFPRGGGLPFAVDSILPGLVLGAIAFGLAWLLFRPCCSSSGEAAPRPAVKPGGASRRGPRFFRPGALAIAWKDFHFLNGGFRGIVIRALVYTALLGAWMLWAREIRWSMSARDTGVAIRTFGLMAFSMELALVGVRILGVERKRKTLGGLFTLPLGTGGLIGQKVLGALPVFIPSVAMYLLGVAIIVNSGTLPSWQGASLFNTEQFLFVASEYVLFAVLVAYLSLRMRHSALASGIALMFFGHLLVGLMFSGVLRSFSASVVIVWLFIAIFASRIPGRIAAAAAEE